MWGFKLQQTHWRPSQFTRMTSDTRVYVPVTGGYPYEVCNDGTVNRLGSRDKPMKTGKKNEGYQRVNMYMDGEQKSVKVAKLVMLGFKRWEYMVGRMMGMTIDHINQLEWDNRVENLRMATHQQQGQNQDRTLAGKGRRDPVDQLDMDGAFLKTHISTAEAGKHIEKSPSGITACINGRLSHFGGFKWRYSPNEDDADLPGEVWKQFRGGNSFVSNMNRYKWRRPDGSFKRIETGAEKKSKKAEYPMFKHEEDAIRLHLAVAEVFDLFKPDGWTPNTDEWIVCHKDCDKTNAALDNLEWMTRKDGSKHATDSGCIEFYKIPVIQIQDGVTIARFDSAVDAAKATGVSRCHIQKCINGQVEVKYNKTGEKRMRRTPYDWAKAPPTVPTP